MDRSLSSQTQAKVIHSHPIWLPQTQTWMYNQVRYLTSDIESHIVCEKIANIHQFRLPNIHTLDSAPKWHCLWDKGLRKLKIRQHLNWLVNVAKREGADIVHSHFGPVGWANLGAIRQIGLKHVVTFYGQDVNCLPKSDPVWIDRYHELFASVDRVLCEGSHMAQCIVNLGCPQRKVHVHHLGIAIDEIAFKPRNWNSNEPLRVLISGSFREKKGIPYALEALGHLQHQVPLEVTIIGDADTDKDSQNQKQLILETIRRCNLHSKVRLLGYQPYTIFFKEAYAHHIFLSPSITASNWDTEGGAPVSLIEMVATGMPIISTRHCDIPEVVIDGVTGLLAKEKDVDELVAHLQRLASFPEKWHDLAKAGRQHVEKEYNAQVQGLKLAAIYKALNE